MKKEFTIPEKYKKYLFPAGTVLAAIFIIFAVIFPQIGNISDLLQKNNSQRDEIIALTTSHENLVSQPQTELDAMFNTTLTALPTEKQVALIFSGLSQAAVESGTSIREFSLTVGGVFGRAAALSTGVTTTPGVTVIVRLAGTDSASFAEFARKLKETLPLSEVKKITVAGDTATYEVNFFYKPVDVAKVRSQDKIPPMSPQDTELVKTLSSWELEN